MTLFEFAIIITITCFITVVENKRHKGQPEPTDGYAGYHCTIEHKEPASVRRSQTQPNIYTRLSTGVRLLYTSPRFTTMPSLNYYK